MLRGPAVASDDHRARTGKWPAGAYALFAGVVFLVLAGIMLGPVIHAVLHRFHLERAANDPGER